MVLPVALLAVVAGGWVLLAASSRAERAWSVAFPLAFAVGLSVWIVAASILGLVMPFRIAVLVSLGALAAIGTAGAARHVARNGRELGRTLRPRFDGPLALLLASAAIGAYVAWHASTFGGSSEENLYFHSTIAGVLARGDYPPIHPLEPDFQLVYRLGFHMLAAAIQIVSGVHIAAAMAVAVVLSVTLATWLVYALAIRAGAGPWPAKLTAAAFVLASPANWLALPIAAQQVGGSLIRGERYMAALTGAEASVVNGLGVIKQVETNVTLVAGYMPAIAALAILAPLGQRARRLDAREAVIAAVLLAYALSTNEALYAVVVVGAGLAAVLGSRTFRRDRVPFLGAIAASIPLGLLAGSLPTTLILSGRPTPAALSVDASHLGRLPGIGWLDATAASAFFPSGADLKYPALWNPAVLGEFWWLGVAIAVGAFLALRGDRMARVLTLTALAGITLPQVVTVDTFPWDGFRFFAAVVPIGGILVGHIVGRTWRVPGPARRVGALRTGAIVLVLVAVGSAVAGSAMWPGKLARLENASITNELEATRRLWRLPPGQRVLVVAGATSFEELHSGVFPHAISKYVLGFGGQYVPMGHDRYSQPEYYLADYKAASSALDVEAIERLGVDVVYVSPSDLTREQTSTLETLVSQGTLRLMFSTEDGGDGRQLYVVERLT